MQFRTFCQLQQLGGFHPFIGQKGPQGEQMYSFTLFLTSALEGGEGSASHPGRTLPPGKRTGTHCTGARWASGPVWTGAENFVPNGIRSPDHPSGNKQRLLSLKSTTCFGLVIAKQRVDGEVATQLQMLHDLTCILIILNIDNGLLSLQADKLMTF